ncbi:DUF3710 domain-containing protein [Brachybacterium hainanense]|uniref:DUF3710 domain-containing protein n=1 Tax=Brachybacterium hainanense TaxID=1541174 RepID=A0ABV6REI4_9MICO
MGLFSRRRKQTEDAAQAADRIAEEQDDAARTPEPEETEKEDAGGARPEHLEPGPYDAADAPEEERIDLGGLLIPLVKGLELRMEMDQRSRAVTGANLVLDGSSLQLQAFAAPKTRGLWDEVRGSLRESITAQGGTAETRTGPFGTELIARLPLKRADGRTGYRPARFIGVDGPRWFVRAILSGAALSDREQSARFETLLSRIVVVRGRDAMAPQELIPLSLPGQRAGVLAPAEDPLDPLARGPEITEIG